MLKRTSIFATSKTSTVVVNSNNNPIAIPVSALVQQGFHVQMPWAVQWGDEDVMGHVNNCVYIRWFESIRVAYMTRIGMSVSNPAPADQRQHQQQSDEYLSSSASSLVSVAPILASISCKYRRPLHFPDQLVLCAKVTSLEKDRFTIHHGVWSASQQTLAAVGDGVIVGYDYNNKKRVALTQNWIDAIQKLDEIELKQ